MRSAVRYYGVSLIGAALAVAYVVIFSGPAALAAFANVLAVGVGFSIDNVVINGMKLRLLGRTWQRCFTTVGVVIGIGGMCVAFPIAVTAFSTGLGPVEVVRVALSHSAVITEKLGAAEPSIKMFGGTYLTLTALTFAFKKRELLWLHPVERRLMRLGRFKLLPIGLICVLDGLLGQVRHDNDLLLAGVLAIGLFAVVFSFMEMDSDATQARTIGRIGLTGWAGFAAFLALELQNASLDLDMTIGAFGVTPNVPLIVVGLSVCVLFIRSMTLHVVKGGGGIGELRYMEHGVHWAIASLGSSMLISLVVPVPDYLPGLVATIFIAAATLHSFGANRRDGIRMRRAA